MSMDSPEYSSPASWAHARACACAKSKSGNEAKIAIGVPRPRVYFLCARANGVCRSSEGGREKPPCILLCDAIATIFQARTQSVTATEIYSSLRCSLSTCKPTAGLAPDFLWEESLTCAGFKSVAYYFSEVVLVSVT